MKGDQKEITSWIVQESYMRALYSSIGPTGRYCQ